MTSRTSSICHRIFQPWGCDNPSGAVHLQRRVFGPPPPSRDAGDVENQARSDRSGPHCSTSLVQEVPSLLCTQQFTRSACAGGQPRGVKPDRQCLVSQEKPDPVTETTGCPNCTDARRLVTQPAWLTQVNRRQNPRYYGRAYGNYWPQPKWQCRSDITVV
ncbi:hypothetical protein D3C78_804290 [compost metagenome]